MKRLFLIIIVLMTSVLCSAQVAGGAIKRPSKQLNTNKMPQKSQVKSHSNSNNELRLLAKAIKKYDYVGMFYNDLALVEKNNKWGYIDKKGNEIIPCIYDDADHFENDYAVAKLGNKSVCLDKQGKVQFYTLYEFSSYFDNKKNAAVKKDGKYGVIDTNGSILIPVIYDEVNPFINKIASVKLNGKYGYVNETGKLIIPCIYDYIIAFSWGLSFVEKNNKWGIINNKGETIIPFIYDSIYEDSTGITRIENNGKFGYFNKSLAKEIIGCIYDDAGIVFTFGYAKVMKDSLWGCIDLHGRQVIPCKYNDIMICDTDMFAIKENNKFKLVDCNLNILTQYEYDKIYEFNEGLALVYQDGKEGFIDRTGKEVIPCKYKYCSYFKNGVCITSWGHGVINRYGVDFTHGKYDSVERDEIERNVLWVSKNGKKGLIDLHGKELLPCSYEWTAIANYSRGYEVVIRFSCGLARITKDGKVGFVNTKGNSTFDYE